MATRNRARASHVVDVAVRDEQPNGGQIMLAEQPSQSLGVGGSIDDEGETPPLCRHNVGIRLGKPEGRRVDEHRPEVNVRGPRRSYRLTV